MVLQHSLVENLHFGTLAIILSTANGSRDFATKLHCNTIIHLLFHYFFLHRSLLHFKLATFKYYLVTNIKAIQEASLVRVLKIQLGCLCSSELSV